MTRFLGSLFLLLALAGCSNAPPRGIQVFSQVNRVFDPEEGEWSSRLSAFVQATSADGTKVFDRLHLVHEGQGLLFTLTRDQWARAERAGEFWAGANDLAFPDGKVPVGSWRAVLVTRAGLKVELGFEVPGPRPGVGEPREGRVVVRADASQPGRYQVSGWVDDYLVWSRDANGAVVARTKTVGPSFTVVPGARSFQLYSYDKDRGEGLLAGPFPVQDRSEPADR